MRKRKPPPRERIQRRKPRRLHPLVDHQDEVDWSENDLLDISPAPIERSDPK